jgi:YVTN family beta-propeller protein
VAVGGAIDTSVGEGGSAQPDAGSVPDLAAGGLDAAADAIDPDAAAAEAGAVGDADLDQAMASTDATVAEGPGSGTADAPAAPGDASADEGIDASVTVPADAPEMPADASVDEGIDASVPGPSDAPADEGTDLSVDQGADAPIDVAAEDDGPPDAAPPALIDMAVDLENDGPPDVAAIDQAVDSEPDVVADSAPDSAPDSSPDAPAAPRSIPTKGSAVAVTANGLIAVAANRTAGRLTVFDINPSTPLTVTSRIELDVGKTAEPWAVVIGNDDDTAYVILRRAQKVLKVTSLSGSPAIDAAQANTGSEPTGLAISPTGASLYVANWAEGTVTVVATASMTVTRTVNLNAALAASGLLGTVSARPGLAHPRALVVTNNGDTSDDDETVFVTEFFSQARTSGVPSDDSQFDVGRQGVVYQFDAGMGTVGSLITLSPVSDTGFPDSQAQTTGCFPNQLGAAAINNGRLYVTGVCASPRGPLGIDGTSPANFKTLVHAAVFAVDISTRQELPLQRVVLTRAFQTLYDTLSLPESAARRMPLAPSDIAFTSSGHVAYVTAHGADAVFRVVYNSDGSLNRVGSPVASFINLKPGGAVPPGEHLLVDPGRGEPLCACDQRGFAEPQRA